MRTFILLLLVSYLGHAQSVSINPDRFLVDKKGGIAPCPLFIPNPDDTAIFPSGKYPKFILPKSSGASGFIFIACPFTPLNYFPEQRSLVYFTHVGQSGMQAYVDRNFNHDYTDDGMPANMSTDGFITISLSLPTDSKIQVQCKYRLLKSAMDISTLPIDLFANNPFYWGVRLLDKSGWLAAEQLWIKGKDIIIGTDSMCVVCFDRDIDGCFTDKQDLIALMPYGTDSAYTTQYNGVRQITPGLILGFHGKAYEVVCDTTLCSPISLKRRADLVAPISLSVGDALPHFSFALFSGDSVDVYSLMEKDKFTYIDFWGMWCAGCRMSIPTLRALHDSIGNPLTIISIDAYDDREKVKDFARDNDMSWLQGFSNPEIEKLLYAGDGFPYGILIDPSGRIVAFDVSASRVGPTIRR